MKKEETNKKCNIVLRFEIYKRINRNTLADITITDKVLQTPNLTLATGYWQHPLKFPISACHCSMSTDIIIKQNEPS